MTQGPAATCAGRDAGPDAGRGRCRRTRAGLALGLALTASATLAEDAIAVTGPLTDEDFYRLVSCAAPPGGACTGPVLRWDAERPIRASLRRIDPGYLGGRKYRAEAAFTRAVRELNAAGAGFRLARVAPDVPAEIGVYFLDLVDGAPIAGTGVDWVDGADVDRITTRVAVDPAGGLIRAAVIVASAALETTAYETAVLAQLTRAMGLMTAVASPAYRGVSVLADDPAGTTRLAPQDITALKRHYAADAQ